MTETTAWKHSRYAWHRMRDAVAGSVDIQGQVWAAVAERAIREQLTMIEVSAQTRVPLTTLAANRRDHARHASLDTLTALAAWAGYRLSLSPLPTT
jgi:hypothetical protein